MLQHVQQGKCEVKGCLYSHSKAAADKIALRKLQDIIKSPMVDEATKHVLRTSERQLLDKNKGGGTPGAKTMLSRSR